MSEHTATIEWNLDGADFGPGYDRTHVWRFDGGVEVPASSAPNLFGDPSRVDPEEAFVASIASCHMMWFLYLAAEDGLVVESYVDEPVGVMRRVESGVQAITDVELRPVIRWNGDEPPAEAVVDLHDRSHHQCFIANSVRTNITVAGR